MLILVVMVAMALLGPCLPLCYQEILYGLSISTKSAILLFLPFLIFSLLFRASVHLANKAIHNIILILVCVVVSNAVSTLLSFGLGTWVYHLDLSMALPSVSSGLQPQIFFECPTLGLGNDKAMLMGVVLGLIAVYVFPRYIGKIEQWANRVLKYALQFLKCMIPFFLSGFIIKLRHDGLLVHLFKDYAYVFIIMGGAQILYVLGLYTIANRFNAHKVLTSLYNMLPASFVGLSTMSSAIAMPLTLAGSEKNVTESHVAQTVIPITANIHLLGDCFAIPIFAFALLKSYGCVAPDFYTYLTFV